MVKEFTEALFDKVEKTNYSVVIPQAFDNLYSNDANFEMASSNNIQPLKLFFLYNIVTHKISVVFVHGCKSDYGKYFLEWLEKAVDLLENFLKFSDVKVFKDLSKSQVIEKLDLIQCEAEDFEQQKSKPDADNNEENKAEQPIRQDSLLVVAIVNIGCFIPWMTRERRYNRRNDREIDEKKM